MSKYIELEEVMKLIDRINLVVYGYKMNELRTGIIYLPTIDPIAIIDEMQESIKFHKPEGIEYMQSTLTELKSRLSLNK